VARERRGESSPRKLRPLAFLDDPASSRGFLLDPKEATKPHDRLYRPENVSSGLPPLLYRSSGCNKSTRRLQWKRYRHRSPSFRRRSLQARAMRHKSSFLTSLSWAIFPVRSDRLSAYKSISIRETFRKTGKERDTSENKRAVSAMHDKTRVARSDRDPIEIRVSYARVSSFVLSFSFPPLSLFFSFLLFSFPPFLLHRQ